MGTILQDIRYALRMQRKNPGFTAVALITLALGIGANTAIFSVVYGILLRPLPYVHPERIVQLCESYQNQQYEKDLTSSGLQFLQAHAGAFQSLAAFTNVGFNLAAGGSAEHVNGLHVSSGYFRVLGVDALIGRTFSPEEDSGDGARVAILSEGLWKRMGSDRSMLGRTVLLDGSTYTVVGVMPGDFERLNTPLTHGETEVWAPMALVRRTVGSGENLAVIGRLKDGISLDQARSQVGIVGEDFRRAFPDHLAPASRLDLEPYQTMLSSDSRTILMVLFGAVFLVLLIACANIANLLLGRAVVRGREIAIRTALGGSRARLFRQLVTESLLLSMLGALAGVGLATWGLKLILALSPADLPRVGDIRLDLHALGFALGLALFTGLAFGLAPAFRACRHNLNETLKEGTGRMSPGKRPAFFRSALVVAEIGLALMLLTGAVLLTETFWRVLRTDPGFNPSHVLSMQVWLNGSKYDSTETVANFYDDVLQRIQHLPGVQSAAVIAAGLPLERGGNMPVEIPGRATPDGYGFRMVTPEYFRTMGIPLKAGRFIDVGDNPHGGAVAVVSESLAKRLFPNQNVLGEHLRVGQDDSDREIVGVVGDVKSYLDQPAEPTVFIPVAQAPYGMMKIFESWFATSILVRTAIDPLALSHSVQEQLRAADPSVASGHIRTMEQVRSTAVAMRQFNMTLLALFAALASALAALGIYGVMAYNVRQRTHEIGVRVAFGAQRSHILGMIYREALLLASIGIAIGTACALALTRLLESYLYEVKARDPVAFVGTVLVLGAVAMLACVIPARRAVKVDPMVALRYE
jgi:putative ABC transport system permease protein